MPVAIVHYHLRRGGVTRVIEAQSQALRERGIEHVILAGSAYHGPFDLPVAVLPDLDYLDDGWPGGAGQLAAALRATAAAALGNTPPAIWHFHNPALGKNVLWPGMLRTLAEFGERIVCQHHDFAEDGRPRIYEQLAAHPDLYPIAPQIRHAFINSRDRAILIRAGIPSSLTEFLPNALIPPSSPSTAGPAADGPVVLYPVRGIRRKNLGEFCLLAALAPEGARFALTLKPENPDWRPVFDRWELFAMQHHLPVDLGVVGRVSPAPGVDPTYDNWLAHCTHLVTTSVAEGFGLSFLEPIALRKPLFGRDIPDITSDFRDAGLQLGDLYDSFLVPRDWIDPASLRYQFEHALRRTYYSYRRELPPASIDAAYEALFTGDFLDFGNLPEHLQEEAARKALRDPGALRLARGTTTTPAAAWLRDTLRRDRAASDPAALDAYSLSSCGAQLAGLYDRLREAQVQPPEWLDAGKVLDQFLLPGRFHFLRT